MDNENPGAAVAATPMSGAVTAAKARAHFRMDRTERFYKIDHLIRERGVVPVAEFLRELEVSLATFKRDIEYMRSRHHAPIEWDRDAGGYRFVKADSAAPVYELPGLWFSPREAQALLTMQHLLSLLKIAVYLMRHNMSQAFGRLKVISLRSLLCAPIVPKPFCGP